MAGEGQPVDRVDAGPVRVHVWLALAAVAIGLYVGGGLRRPQAVEFACAAAIALVWAFVAVGPRRTDVNLLTGSLAALALLAVGRAQIAGDAGAGLGYVLLCGTTIALFLIAQRTSGAERRALVDGTIALIALLAVSGLAGLALHSEPLALAGTGAWRVSTTLTYPNAAAALFGPAALLALDRADRCARPRWAQAAAALLLTGSLTTLSRAAPLALIGGLVVWCARAGFGRAARAAIPALVGTLVFGASLVPVLGRSSRAAPLLAVVGGAAALGAVVGVSRMTRRTSARGLAAGAMLVALGVAAAFVVAIGVRGGLGASSADRSHEARAALELVRGAPLAGVGPGPPTLRWESPGGERFQAKYAHNDYLQVGAELGALGLVALGMVLWAAGATAWRAGRTSAAPLVADVAPAVICFALHVGQDYIAHFPAVVGVVALWVGVAASSTETAPGTAGSLAALRSRSESA